jgi:hypothetical protein
LGISSTTSAAPVHPTIPVEEVVRILMRNCSLLDCVRQINGKIKKIPSGSVIQARVFQTHFYWARETENLDVIQDFHC